MYKEKKKIFMEQYTDIQKLTLSGLIIGLYCIIMYFTQSISFGPYQIRIATALYSLAYIYPFLILPLGIANFLSNMLGGLGLIDMIGGCIVGIITAYLITLIRNYKCSLWICAFPIIFVPGTIVPIWLSAINSLPYSTLVISLCIGQIIPSLLGVALTKTLSKILNWKGAVK